MRQITGPDKIGWVHIEDRRLLVGRNRGATLFYLPGGGREVGEQDVETLVREAAEELGVALKDETVRLVGRYVAQRDGRDDYLNFIAYTADFEGTITPQSEVEEITWITSADGAKVTDAGRQVMATLVERGALD